VSGWHPVDLVIAAAIALSVVIGLVRGFVVEVMALVVWFGAAALAWIGGETVAGWFESLMSMPSLRLGIGYAVVFFSVLTLGAVLVFLLRKLVHSTGLSGTDRLLGSLFGLARGALVIAVVVLLAGFTPLPRDPWWRESALLPLFVRGAEQLAAALPASVRERIDLSPEAADTTGRDDVVPTNS
jgi:membrane protein required for colicin V production